MNDLLDLSRIEAGRVDLELSPLSLFDLLHEAQDTLESRAAELRLRVVSNAAGAPARIEVVDTGPGIQADRIDAIFQPFIVDATPAIGDAATGLGLAITRALCDLMGYRLTVSSEVGVGSTFAVHLLSEKGLWPPVDPHLVASV